MSMGDRFGKEERSNQALQASHLGASVQGLCPFGLKSPQVLRSFGGRARKA